MFVSMDLEHALEKLGLSDKEARVYLAGLALGPASVQDLSARAKVKRTTIYEILQILKEKELFKESVRGKRHLFIAVHPNQLKVDLNDKERVLERVFPELDQILRLEKGKPHILYHNSLEAIHRVYEDALKKTQKETVGIGSVEIARRLGEEWLDGYIKKRKKFGIRARTIVDSRRGEWYKRDAQDERSTRVLPGGRALPINLEIFDDTALITSLEGEAFTLSIESRKVSEALKTLFETVWEVSERPAENPPQT